MAHAEECLGLFCPEQPIRTKVCAIVRMSGPAIHAAGSLGLHVLNSPRSLAALCVATRNSEAENIHPGTVAEPLRRDLGKLPGIGVKSATPTYAELKGRPYGRALRDACKAVGISGSADLARLAYDEPDADTKKMVLSHWKGYRPTYDVHDRYAKAIMRAGSEAAEARGTSFFEGSQIYAQLEHRWQDQATERLETAFDFDQSAYPPDENAMPWPAFVDAWVRGELADVVDLRVGIDFSGRQDFTKGGLSLEFRGVRGNSYAHFESVLIVEYKSRPRLAKRLEYSPVNRNRGEMWFLFYDDILWRSPSTRIHVLKYGLTKKSIPEEQRKGLDIREPEITYSSEFRVLFKAMKRAKALLEIAHE